MRRRIASGLAGGVLALALAFPAYAEISTQEVRDAFVGFYERMGYTVDIGSQSTTGDTMTLKDVSVAVSLPNDKGQFSGVYDWMKLKQVNGTVEITLAPNLKIKGESSPSSNKKFVVLAHLETTDAVAVASGSIDDLTLKSSMSGVNFVLDKVEAGGKALPFMASVTGGDLQSTIRIAKLANDRKQYDGTSSLASIAFKFNVKNPDGPGSVATTGNISDMTSTFSYALNTVDAAEMLDPMAFFKLGIAGGGSLSSGPFKFSVNSDVGGKTADVKIAGDTGQLAFNLSKKAIKYSLSEKGVKFDIAASDLPVPRIKFGYDSLGFSFNIPLAKAAEPSDFQLKAALRGLSVDESLWSMIDPGKSLSRDPITVAVDLSGKLMVLADLMNPKTIENLNGPPMLPASVNLNELTVSAVGALLTGKGGVTFDFSGGKMVSELLTPVGSVTLDLTGGYGLMEKLVAMGLLPDQTAAGIRAMVGAFSKPVGDDHIRSTIEAAADGTITANGQRIK